MVDTKKKVTLSPAVRGGIADVLKNYPFVEVSHIIAPFLVPDAVTEFLYDDVDYAYRFIANKESYANSFKLLRAVEQEVSPQIAAPPPVAEPDPDPKKSSKKS